VGGWRFSGPVTGITPGVAIEPSISIAATAGWRVTLAADTTNDGLSVLGTGEVNKTIRWVARVLSAEVTA
jgi:hypothetical protein